VYMDLETQKKGGRREREEPKQLGIKKKRKGKTDKGSGGGTR